MSLPVAPDKQFFRCCEPGCRNRTAGNLRYCHLHGGVKFVPQVERDRFASDPLSEGRRMAIEDLIVHIKRCKHCQETRILKPVWEWEGEHLVNYHIFACETGKHLAERLTVILQDIEREKLCKKSA